MWLNLLKPPTPVYIHKVKVKSLSHVQLFVTPWTVAYQAPPSMGFSRQECWSGLPFPSPGDLPDPGVKPGSPTLQADALPSEPPGKPTYIYIQNHRLYNSDKTELDCPRRCIKHKCKVQCIFTKWTYSRVNNPNITSTPDDFSCYLYFISLPRITAILISATIPLKLYHTHFSLSVLYLVYLE